MRRFDSQTRSLKSHHAFVILFFNHHNMRNFHLIMSTRNKTIQKLAVRAATAALAATMTSSVLADINVAFFLEWATPNQIAKVEKAYDEALGETVNWTNFDAGTEMTEAMLAGDIDISYSQGLAPFVTGVKARAPIKTVAIAVVYPPNPCIVRNGAGITHDNASELEGQAVAVPLNTMADYSFQQQMLHLGVDISKIQVVDQVPADGAVSLADGNVVMACLFGGNSITKASEHGTKLMTDAETKAAGFGAFDVVSVTEKFAQENPDALRTFLEVTHEANAAFANDQSKIGVIAKDAGMTVDGARGQMDGFIFPTPQEQLSKFFSSGGQAVAAFKSLGAPLDSIDASFLK